VLFYRGVRKALKIKIIISRSIKNSLEKAYFIYFYYKHIIFRTESFEETLGACVKKVKSFVDLFKINEYSKWVTQAF